MEKTSEKKLLDQSFDDLLKSYEKDTKTTEKKGLEHGISQVNMLRMMTMDLSLKSDLDLKDENINEKLDEMIDLYVKGIPAKIEENRQGANQN